MKHYADDWLTIYQGDVRAVLPELASDSVDCIVTSPPYWGLRDYGTASWDGGDAACDHRGQPMRTNNKPSDSTATFHGGTSRSTEPWKDGVCGKCGAVRQDSQIGLERTPEEYVANLVAVFRELRRVLKPSGTCWLNLGDSYAGSQQTGRNDAGRPEKGRGWAEYDIQRTRVEKRDGLKPKDLVGIPWRVAFALQADGWYLRSDIIWAKPNPMPESVTDRPTKAHEYLFLLTKSARYYYDADAVREAGQEWAGRAGTFARNGDVADHIIPNQSAAEHRADRTDRVPAGRNLRSVWTIATRPYPGAHFAVFPPELPERCIKAGSSERGVCPECGKPWERVVEVVPDSRQPYRTMGAPRPTPSGTGSVKARVLREDGKGGDLARNERKTTGWRPSCLCGLLADPHPAVVLDPFAGSCVCAHLKTASHLGCHAASCTEHRRRAGCQPSHCHPWNEARCGQPPWPPRYTAHLGSGTPTHHAPAPTA